MKDKEDLAPPPPARGWTRVEDYVEALARRRTARRSRAAKPRTQPEAPRFALSTLPFLVLIAALAVITVGIVLAAWPGERSQPKPRSTAQQLGTAEKGWFQEAEREFHNAG